jgi:hypothetical protein
MAENHTVIFKLSLEILPNDTSLNAGKHVHLVNPLYSVHSRAIERDNHALFLGAEHEGLCHIGATAIRNDGDVMLICKLNNSLYEIYNLSKITST